MPSADDPIWICDTFGEMGLVYRLAQAVLIGGTFSDIAGHNPWEAASLTTAILHGPSTANFAFDFAQLATADASIAVTNADELARALAEADLPALAERAALSTTSARAATAKLAARLIEIVRG